MSHYFTGTNRYGLECDNLSGDRPCYRTFHPRTIPACGDWRDLPELRAAARRRGWQSVDRAALAPLYSGVGLVDFCPEHHVGS